VTCTTIRRNRHCRALLGLLLLISTAWGAEPALTPAEQQVRDKHPSLSLEEVRILARGLAGSGTPAPAKPAWASEMGADVYGTWAKLVVGARRK
jgi:hypothetical protein